MILEINTVNSYYTFEKFSQGRIDAVIKGWEDGIGTILTVEDTANRRVVRLARRHIVSMETRGDPVKL